LAGEGSDRYGLPIARARAPDQRDLDLAAGSAAKINASGILLSFDQRQPGLPDAMRCGSVELDAWTLITDKRPLFVHDHHFVRTDRNPIAEPPPETAARSLISSLRLFRGNRKIKFAVIDHLRPETPIHQLSAVLDEPAVEILRDGRSDLAGVDVGLDQ
jgi:hypothetical protein